jgi:mannosyltransferase OCH1-like enzyme
MIEKIQAVWLGERMPPLAHACIDDWAKQGYSFKLWTDQDDVVREWIHSCAFAEACYKRKLYAFVSDYLRLKVLQSEGGLYLDTDVTIRKNPFPLFSGTSFSVGYETKKFLGTASIYAEKDSSILQKIIEFYEKDIWASPLYIGPQILTHLLIDKDYRNLETCKLYPIDYFYCYQQEPIEFNVPENSHLIHWFQNSWGKSPGLVFLKSKHLGLLKSLYVWQKYFFRGRL